MTLLTALEIAGNYPENILITSADGGGGQYSAWMYMTRDGDIHKTMLHTTPVFETADAAENYLHEVCKDVVEKYGQ